MMHVTANGNHAEFLSGTIAGIVTSVPEYKLGNEGWQDALDAEKMTGVAERRRVGHAAQTTESLCLAAAERLMRNLGWRPDEIDTLIYVTQTPGDKMPASAYRLAGALGLNTYCPVLEVNWSCAGYVYGLWLAMKLSQVDQLHGRQKVLLLVGDTVSRICDPTDRATAPLFGDAGSATAIEQTPLSGLNYFVLGSDGTGAARLRQGAGDAFMAMDGAAVFNFTLKIVPPLVTDVLDDGEPDFLLFHQANRFMLEHLAKKMKLAERFSPEQIPRNIERFGNTSCVSIPLLICEQLGQPIAKDCRLALFGYGAGWAWAGASLKTDGLQCAELLEVL